MTKIFISRDAGALCVGAEAVAEAFRKEAKERGGLDVEIVRTGSRGMYWLEPLVEVETDKGRVGYGPVKASEVASLLDAGILEAKPHDKCIGVVEDYPWLKRQTRLTFARCGIVDPRSVEDYQAHEGYEGLKKALQVGPEATVEEVITSGLQRPRRRRLPHRHQMAHRRRARRLSRNTSCATPTKATAAPSPTA